MKKRSLGLRFFLYRITPLSLIPEPVNPTTKDLNYLAHAFLSGTDPELMVGNFIADSVRGKQILQYPESIIKGILLHREIDAFTDSHLVVAATKDRLRPLYGKYAPVIADMYYDHFLAANFQDYSAVLLPVFSAGVYSRLQQYWEILPERVKHFLPHMVRHNWLLSYAGLQGINQALTGLSSRTTFRSGMETAAQELEKNYELYSQDFALFFPELMDYTQSRIKENGNPDPASGV